MPGRRPARNGFLTTQFKPRTYFRGKESIDNEVYTRLRSSIQRLCQIKQIKAELEETDNNINDLLKMITEVNSLLKWNETLNLVGDEDDDNSPLQLTYDRLIPTSDSMFLFCLKPTYDLREEVGDVVRRFLMAFCMDYGINDIRDTTTYNFIKEDLEIQMEEDDDEEAKDKYEQAVKPYEEGKVANIFKEIYQSLREKPYNPEEAERLIPENDKERSILEIVKKGKDFLNPSLTIPECSGLPDADDESDISITTEDSFCLTYDAEDLMNDMFYDFLNMTYQSTGFAAGIVQTITLSPDTQESEFNDELDRMIEYMTILNDTF